MPIRSLVPLSRVLGKLKARVPFLSMALREGGHVSHRSQDRNSAREALKMAATEFNSRTIAVFPKERGAREMHSESSEGRLLTRRTGRAGGSHRILGSRAVGIVQVLQRGGRVWAKVGEPISPEAIKQLTSTPEWRCRGEYSRSAAVGARRRQTRAR